MECLKLNRWYYYDDLIYDANRLAKLYPNIVKIQWIGISHEGRNIPCIRLGSGRQKIVIVSGVHGRESTNPIVLMKMLEYYCWNLSSNGHDSMTTQIKEFFNEFSVECVPLLNPDGYMIALRGFNIIQNETYRLKAKAMNIPYQEWKYNARCIDLNRNFPSSNWCVKWEDDEPASENETKALMNLFGRSPGIGFIDYHSRGKMIYYHRKQMSKDYNKRQLFYAQRLSNMTGYTLANPTDEIEEGDTGGNTVHYYSEMFLLPALTIETVDEIARFPIKLKYQWETFQELKHTPMIFQ